jgi:hypothetical protein
MDDPLLVLDIAALGLLGVLMLQPGTRLALLAAYAGLGVAAALLMVLARSTS